MTKHLFVSTLGDGSDPTLIKPSNWNAPHVDGVKAVSGNTTGSISDDVILATTGGGGITYSMPTPAQAGTMITLIKVDSGAGALTINPFASETFNWLNHPAMASYSLINQGQAACFVSDGTNWWLKFGN